MTKKILSIVCVLLLVFIGYVSTRPSYFNYERSGLINAPAEKIYPHLNDFKAGHEWSPYEKIDPNMKRTFSGPEKGTGSVMEFDGNMDVGSGRLEIIKEIPNQLVEIKLDMIKPIKGSNTVHYKLAPEGNGTRFTWTMSGEGGFLSKLMAVFIDCEKMIGNQFSQGIQNLKTIVESKK